MVQEISNDINYLLEGYKKLCASKDERIANLHKLIETKEEHTEYLNNLIERKDRLISSLLKLAEKKIDEPKVSQRETMEEYYLEKDDDMRREIKYNYALAEEYKDE